MSVKIKMRYDTLANWTNTNPEPTLLPGEFGVANDNGTIIVKVGNGDAATNEAVTWTLASEISGTGTPIEGLDFTDLQAGEVLFWDGTTWYGRGLDQLISGGNKISVTRDPNDGTISIAYYDTLFNLASPTWTAPDLDFGTTSEVGTPYSNFSISVSNVKSANNSTSNVDLCSGTLNQNHSPSRITGWANTNLTVAGNIGSATVSELSIATGDYTWFTPSATSINFSTTGTARFTGNQTDCASGNSTLSDTESRNKQFAWRFWGFTSEESLSLAEVDTYVNNLDDNALNGGGLKTNPNAKINVSWNYAVQTVDTNSTSVADRFLYFAVSTASANTNNYSWEPVFYPPGVGLPDNQFQKLGSIQLNGTGGNNLYYTIYRSDLQTSSSASFDID